MLCLLPAKSKFQNQSFSKIKASEKDVTSSFPSPLFAAPCAVCVHRIPFARILGYNNLHNHAPRRSALSSTNFILLPSLPSLPFSCVVLLPAMQLYKTQEWYSLLLSFHLILFLRICIPFSPSLFLKFCWFLFSCFLLALYFFVPSFDLSFVLARYNISLCLLYSACFFTSDNMFFSREKEAKPREENPREVRERPREPARRPCPVRPRPDFSSPSVVFTVT